LDRYHLPGHCAKLRIQHCDALAYLDVKHTQIGPLL
jgi:hypothetical protein